jgi:DNA-3-methyladenine glycosylase II
MDTFTIEPRGRFSLEEAALFGFGQRNESTYDGTMRLAFCLDGYERQAGVSLTQAADGVVHGTISGISGISGRRTSATSAIAATSEDRATVVAQVARVLSIDHDATGYEAVGDRDPIIARLLEAAPGLRPPLFYSPYEGALWSVLSMRRPRQTAERWRARLSEAAGARFDVAGREQWAVPTPVRIIELGVDGVATAAGIEPARAQRVVGVAEAAEARTLDATTLAGMGEDRARAELQTIPGIGPFYADLVVVRASGVTDVLPLNEPRLFALVGELYGLSGPVTAKEAERVAEAWRPWRTWIAVLIRSAGPRVLGQAP